jgi:VanZ family protein
VLFVPLGYFQGKLFFKRPFLKVMFLEGALAFFISYTVEYLQLYIAYRHTSLVDCFFNVTGAMAGVWIARHVRIPPIFIRAKRLLRTLLRSRWALPSLAAWIMIVLEAWHPFNFTLSAEMLQVKLTVLSQWRLSFPPNYWVFLARYALVFAWGASLLTAWLYDTGYQKFLLLSICLSMIAGTLLEWSQWLILSRMPGAPETLAVFIGSLAGGLLFLFIPKHFAPASSLFWFAAGLFCAYFFRFIPPGNMDYYKIGFYHGSLTSTPLFLLIVSLINHMTLFWFMGFLGYYMVNCYKLMPRRSLLNSVLFVAGFFLTAKFAVRFSPLTSYLRFILPLLAAMAGISICIWGVSCFRGYFRVNLQEILASASRSKTHET